MKESLDKSATVRLALGFASEPPSEPAPVARRLWHNRDLRLAVAGRAASLLGDEVATVAVVLAAYDAGWGAPGVAAVFVAAALPLVLGAAPAGRLVDRVDSRRVTVLAALWQAVAALVAAALLGLGNPESRAVAVAVLLLVASVGAGQAVAGPAWQALVPRVVPDGEVPRAVAAMQSATTLAALAGPGIGGLLVAAGGPARAVLLQAAGFGVLAVLAAAVRTVRRPMPGAGTDPRSSGLALLRADRLLAVLVGGCSALIVLIQVVAVVNVVLVRDVLGAGAVGYGLLNTGFGAAMLLGTVAGGRLAGTQATQLRAVLGGFAAVSTGVGLGGLAPSSLWFGVALVGVGLGNGVLNVGFGSFLARRVEDEVRGRLFAAVAGVSQGASVLGMAAGGVVGSFVGPRVVCVAAGAVALVVTGAVAAVVGREASASARPL